MPISEMVGKTPKKITIGRNKDKLNFYFSDGTLGRFYHEQDCCESVFISDVSGDVADVIICTQNLAACYGIDLREAVTRKFNATSDKVGYPQKLPAFGEDTTND
jgi:hypothetical protein